jgi:hypothetical protein
MTASKKQFLTEKLDAFFDTVSGYGLSGDTMIAMARAAAAKGLLSPDLRDARTPEEKEEYSTVKEEAAKTIYHWLRTHEAPIYTGQRETCRTAGEIVDMIVKDGNITRSRMTLGLARSIIEGESTGWGLVASSDGKRFYARKAVLLTYRKKEDQNQTETEDQESHVA